MNVLNFAPLFFWMLGFYALHITTSGGAQVMKDRPNGVLLLWCLGTALFLFVGLWTSRP